MKISYLNNIKDHKELNRGKYFSKLENFKIKNNFEFIKCFPKAEEIFITDHTSTFLLSLIIFLCIVFRKRITLWSIEIFTIEREAFLSEFKSQKYSSKKSFFKKSFFYLRYFSILLIEILLNFYSNFSKITIIISSDLRKKYMKKKFQKINFITLRNMPLKKDIILNQINEFKLKTNQKPFIFLAGNVNNYKDFELVASQAYKENIKVLVAGPSHISKYLKQINEVNKGNVEYLGYLQNKDVFNIYQKSMGGLVLYNNSSLNQRMSASCKLFDLMSIYCPVIVSDNLGVIEELNYFGYPHLLCDDFNMENLIKLKNRIKDFKKNYQGKISFVFESECMINISNSLLIDP